MACCSGATGGARRSQRQAPVVYSQVWQYQSLEDFLWIATLLHHRQMTSGSTICSDILRPNPCSDIMIFAARQGVMTLPKPRFPSRVAAHHLSGSFNLSGDCYMPVDLVCEYCGCSFQRDPYKYLRSKHFFCSNTCLYAARYLKRIDPVERFWSHVARTSDPSDCWLWTGKLISGRKYASQNGYGQFYDGNGRTYAHRFAYEITYGLLLPGFLVCHHCDNPPCCRPIHLFPGLPADNTQDALRKGRLPRGERHGSAKLTELEATMILSLQGIVPNKELSERFKVAPETISSIWHRRAWRFLSTPHV